MNLCGNCNGAIPDGQRVHKGWAECVASLAERMAALEPKQAPKLADGWFLVDGSGWVCTHREHKDLDPNALATWGRGRDGACTVHAAAMGVFAHPQPAAQVPVAADDDDKVLRNPWCKCHREEGDSPCPVHCEDGCCDDESHGHTAATSAPGEWAVCADWCGTPTPDRPSTYIAHRSNVGRADFSLADYCTQACANAGRCLNPSKYSNSSLPASAGEVAAVVSHDEADDLIEHDTAEASAEWLAEYCVPRGDLSAEVRVEMAAQWPVLLRYIGERRAASEGASGIVLRQDDRIEELERELASLRTAAAPGDAVRAWQRLPADDRLTAIGLVKGLMYTPRPSTVFRALNAAAALVEELASAPVAEKGADK